MVSSKMERLQTTSPSQNPVPTLPLAWRYLAQTEVSPAQSSDGLQNEKIIYGNPCLHSARKSAAAGHQYPDALVKLEQGNLTRPQMAHI